MRYVLAEHLFIRGVRCASNCRRTCDRIRSPLLAVAGSKFRFPRSSAEWDDALPIWSVLPKCILGALAFRRSSCCGAGKAGRESKLGPLQVPPQLRTAPAEDELETVADKAAMMWSFLLATGNRVRQRLDEFRKLERVAQQPDLQEKVENLSEDFLAANTRRS